MSMIDGLDDLPPVHAAAARDDVAALRRLATRAALRARVDLARSEGPFRQRLTPLMIAAGSATSSAEAVACLLALGARPGARSAAGATALWYAANLGDPARVAALLAAGASPRETATCNGGSVVAEAAGSGSVVALRLLLDAGGSPHPTPAARRDSLLTSYYIPLFRAAESGSADGVRLLLERGARPRLRDHDGGTALNYAGSAAVVTILLAAGCPLDGRDDRRETVIEGALRRGQAEVVRALARTGLDLEERDGWGLTLLGRYCNGHDWGAVDPTAVQALIDSGADLHTRCVHTADLGLSNPHCTLPGDTALHGATQHASSGRIAALGAVIRLLVANGLPVDVRGGFDETPLHRAVDADGGAREAIETLLDLGADINAADDSGRTPLIAAVHWPHHSVETVPLLLRRGADPTRRDRGGWTARDHAAREVQSRAQFVAQGPRRLYERRAIRGDVPAHLITLQDGREVVDLERLTLERAQAVLALLEAVSD